MTRLTACFIALVIASQSNAGLVVLSTADNQFDAGVLNQGWWSNADLNQNANSSIFTGRLGTSALRSFFTFNLNLLPAGTINSATLSIVRGTSSPANSLNETLEFWNVTTPAATLNNNIGPDALIFGDLGSGISYGQFTVPGSGTNTDVLPFLLNANAINAIQNGSGFFSIGGTLNSVVSDHALFIDSTPLAVTLTVDVTAIPEPSSVALVTLGLVTCSFVRRRRQTA